MSLTTSRRTSSDATGRSMSEIRALYSIAGLPQTPIDVDAIGGDEVSPSTQEGNPQPPSSIDVDEIGHEVLPSAEPAVLVYSGYCKHRVAIRPSDYSRLDQKHELNDVLMDMLISHAHAQAFEADPDRLARVVVLPSLFFTALKGGTDEHIINGCPLAAPLDHLRAAHRVVARYDDAIWRSDIVLIPANFTRHWILIVVCNASEAVSAASVPPRGQITNPGDSKPDSQRFSVLSLNSLGRTPKYVNSLVMQFLHHHYQRVHHEQLEFIEAWDVKCPFQLDTISCGLHTIHHAEVIMMPGVCEKLRKSAQGVRTISRREISNIFDSQNQRMDAYRQRKMKVIRQESDLYQALEASRISSL